MYIDCSARLDDLISLIKDPYLQQLCKNLVGHKGKYRDAYLIAPAAKRMHHAYPGGLAEHSIEVADFCISDYNLLKEKYTYQELNLDLLLSASILHDIGKIDEYELIDENLGIYSFTEVGNIIGHLCLSAMWVYSEMENIKDFPKDLKIQLSHIILSHHGRLEWGSAKIPCTKEAEFFHMADHRSAMIAKKG